MDRRSYITGTGLVSALGADLPATWEALLDGRYITTHAAAKLSTTVFTGSRISGLAIRAATEAIASAGWSAGTLPDPATAILFGTSKGDITDWLHPAETSDKTKTAGWTDGAFGLAGVCDDLCRHFGRAAGPRITVSAACASGLQALIRADLMLRTGAAERALVVAAEASIHPLFLASFERLGVLATGDEPGRPFDQNRQGFRMSEAAAAVTLERSPATGRSNLAVTFARMAGEASNLVAGDPSGRASAYLLDEAFRQGPIDFIHAHGTGTTLNDQLEAAAIEQALAKAGGQHPTLFSHKGLLGHSLGASGLVSVVLADAIVQHSQSIPMSTTLRPMPFQKVKLAQQSEPVRVSRSLILANGFGGPQTAVVLSGV